MTFTFQFVESIKQLQEFSNVMDTKFTRMEIKMKEVNEKLGNQAVSAEGCKDEGQLLKTTLEDTFHL